MNAISLTLPENLVIAFRRWLRKRQECQGMTFPASSALSIRTLTPAGPEDSRWHRSLDFRMPGCLTDRQLLARVAYWSRTRRCETFVVPLYEAADRVVRNAQRLEITPEQYCTKCIAYHASLAGGREFEESVFVRFERALAREFREEKAKLAERAAAAVETGLTPLNLGVRFEDAA